MKKKVIMPAIPRDQLLNYYIPMTEVIEKLGLKGKVTYARYDGPRGNTMRDDFQDEEGPSPSSNEIMRHELHIQTKLSDVDDKDMSNIDNDKETI